MAGNNREDPLAYGNYHPSGQPGEEDENYESGERGIIGDTYRKIRGRYQSQPQSSSQPPGSGSGLLGSSIFNRLHGVVHDLGSEVNQRISGKHNPTAGVGHQEYSQASLQQNHEHRYGSFAAEKGENDVKWYVDGCGYMWAVSRALEEARESIWILDCKPNPQDAEKKYHWMH